MSQRGMGEWRHSSTSPTLAPDGDKWSASCPSYPTVRNEPLATTAQAARQAPESAWIR